MPPCLLCPPYSLPCSVLGGADTVGPIWKDCHVVQHHSTANYTHLQTKTHWDPCLSLWRGIYQSLFIPLNYLQMSTNWEPRAGKSCEPVCKAKKVELVQLLLQRDVTSGGKMLRRPVSFLQDCSTKWDPGITFHCLSGAVNNTPPPTQYLVLF